MPAGPPPVFRILLRPANLRRSERRVLLGGGGEDAAGLVHNQGASSAGAYVDSKNMCWHLIGAVYVNGSGSITRGRWSLVLGRWPLAVGCYLRSLLLVAS